MADKGYKSVDMFQKLGNAYYFNGKLKSSSMVRRTIYHDPEWNQLIITDMHNL
jgi:hypothetical protein